MKNDDWVRRIFMMFLSITLVLSGYLFFSSVWNNEVKANSIKTWEFPMLLALFFDNVYVFNTTLL